MSGPLLWIILPLLASGGLLLIRRRVTLTARLATAVCLLSTLGALYVPFDRAIRLGPLTLRVESTLNLLGRQFTLGEAERGLVVLFMLMAAFWFAGISAAGGNRLIAPVGLAVTALLLAALAVRPTVYAVLLVETAVLISIPLLAPLGTPIGRGVLRYLIFQSLAMPLLLLASSALAGVSANPNDAALVQLAVALLGLGFAFWLAVFPLYTWVPLLNEEVHPYASGFLLLVMPVAHLFLGLRFIDEAGWLRAGPQLLEALRLSGGLMIGTAGVWAAFQRQLGRLFGYAVIVESGFALLALSLGTHTGQEFFAAMLLPRIVAFGLWALSASILSNRGGSLQFTDLEDISATYPAAAAGVAAALFSLSGLPLLASFPLRQALLQEVSAARHPLTALIALAGSIGLLFSAVRLLAVLTGGSFDLRKFGESRTQWLLIGVGVLVLLGLGLVPRLILPTMEAVLNSFATW